MIYKIGRPQSGSPICQSLVWLQTELDDTKSWYQLIITITISEKKKHIGQTSLVGTMSEAKKIGNFPVFFLGKWLLWSILWLVDLVEWTLCNRLLQLSDYRCSMTAKCPITLSDYNCTEWLVIYKTADAPITFEEIVMVMININN